MTGVTDRAAREAAKAIIKHYGYWVRGASELGPHTVFWENVRAMVEDAIAWGRSHPEWVSVRDRLPDDSLVVDVWCDGPGLLTAAVRDGGSWRACAGEKEMLDSNSVTHWAPRRAPPAR